MDYRQIYEVLLNTLCENNRQMLHVLTQITLCDDVLLELSLQDAPSSRQLQALTMQKERLVQNLESMSADNMKYMNQLADSISICSDIALHPLYQKMKKLQSTVQEKMQKVLHKEDANNPVISKHLEAYQEKLELDIKIKEIPMEKRQIFFVFPDK